MLCEFKEALNPTLVWDNLNFYGGSETVDLSWKVGSTAQLTLTNAQILALNGTALPIVTALSSGLTASQIIMPIKATLAYTRAVADYATNVELDLIHAWSTVALLKTRIDQTASTFTPFVNNDIAIDGAQGNIFIANSDLNVFVPAGNPTGGNAWSSMVITVFYTIMDVL